MDQVKEIVLNNWFEEYTDTFNKRSLLTKPAIWAEIDYMSIDDPDVSATDIKQQANRDGTAHGLLTWFDGEIADGIHISNGPLATKQAVVYGCGFFPLLEPVEIKKGDTIRLDIRANLRSESYIWRWHTRIFSGVDSHRMMANFQQATS